MTRFFVFLRAINVGGHIVTMDRLRRLFESLGFASVETFIASGNVILQARAGNPRAMEEKIERHLHASLGYEVATFCRSASELAAITRYRPFPGRELEAQVHALYVALLPAPPGEAARRKLMGFRSEENDFRIHEREVYWLCREKMSESAFSGALLERTMQMPATIRNVTTLRKLAAKYPESAATR